MPSIPRGVLRLMKLLNKKIWLGVSLSNWIPHCLNCVNLESDSVSKVTSQAYLQGISTRLWMPANRSIDSMGLSWGSILFSWYVNLTPPIEISVIDPVVIDPPELSMPITMVCKGARSYCLRSPESPLFFMPHTPKRFLCSLFFSSSPEEENNTLFFFFIPTAPATPTTFEYESNSPIYLHAKITPNMPPFLLRNNNSNLGWTSPILGNIPLHIFRQLIPASRNPEGFRGFAKLYSFVRRNPHFCRKVVSFLP